MRCLGSLMNFDKQVCTTVQLSILFPLAWSVIFLSFLRLALLLVSCVKRPCFPRTIAITVFPIEKPPALFMHSIAELRMSVSELYFSLASVRVHV